MRNISNSLLSEQSLDTYALVHSQRETLACSSLRATQCTPVFRQDGNEICALVSLHLDARKKSWAQGWTYRAIWRPYKGLKWVLFGPFNHLLELFLSTPGPCTYIYIHRSSFYPCFKQRNRAAYQEGFAIRFAAHVRQCTCLLL